MRNSIARGSEASPLSRKPSSSTLELSADNSKPLHEGLSREPPDCTPHQAPDPDPEHDPERPGLPGLPRIEVVRDGLPGYGRVRRVTPSRRGAA